MIIVFPFGNNKKRWKTSTPGLQAHELEFLAWFLDDAGADFVHHSADEIFREANAGTLAAAAAIREEFGEDAPEADTFQLDDEGPEMVQFYINQAMGFLPDAAAGSLMFALSRRCRELAARSVAPTGVVTKAASCKD